RTPRANRPRGPRCSPRIRAGRAHGVRFACHWPWHSSEISVALRRAKNVLRYFLSAGFGRPYLALTVVNTKRATREGLRDVKTSASGLEEGIGLARPFVESV